MAVQNPPVFIQAGSHPSEEVRRYFYSMLDGRGGIISPNDLKVQEKGTPNMSVDVLAGRALVPGTEASFQGHYYVESRATENRVIAAADPTNARKDLVVARVKDAAYSGVVNSWDIEVVTGTPAPSPSEPSVPANSWVLAMVDVPANDTAIQNAQITDRRTTQTGQFGRASALGGVIVCTSTTRPAHQEGRVIYETDTDKVFVSDGATWTLPKNRSAGFQVLAQSTSAVGSIGAGEVDVLTGSAVTLVAGRTYKVSFYARAQSSTPASSDTFITRIKVGSTIYAEDHFIFNSTAANMAAKPWRVLRCTTDIAAGSTTFKVSAVRALGSTGTGTISATSDSPMQLVIEEVGSN